VLVLLVLVLERADLGVVVTTAVHDVEDLARGTVLDDVAFDRPLLRRTAVERLKMNLITARLCAQTINLTLNSRCRGLKYNQLPTGFSENSVPLIANASV